MGCGSSKGGHAAEPQPLSVEPGGDAAASPDFGRSKRLGADRIASIADSSTVAVDLGTAMEVGALVGTALLDVGRTIPFVAPVAYAIGTVVSLAQTGLLHTLSCLCPVTPVFVQSPVFLLSVCRISRYCVWIS